MPPAPSALRGLLPGPGQVAEENCSPHPGPERALNEGPHCSSNHGCGALYAEDFKIIKRPGWGQENENSFSSSKHVRLRLLGWEHFKASRNPSACGARALGKGDKQTCGQSQSASRRMWADVPQEISGALPCSGRVRDGCACVCACVCMCACLCGLWYVGCVSECLCVFSVCCVCDGGGGVVCAVCGVYQSVV